MTDKLEREPAIKLIEDLHRRFGQGGADPVHEVDRLRTEHYFNESSVDPSMLKGYEAHARQWTGLRDKNVELSARLTANPILPDVSAPRPSSNLEKQASDNELALLTMMEEIAEEDGVSPQVLIADGIGRMSAVGLHWYLNDNYEGLEDLDYEERDDLSEFDDEDDDDDKRKKAKAKERARFTDEDYRPVGRKARKKKLALRETEDSLMERRYAQKAQAGAPWCVEILESTEFAYMENPKPLRKTRGPYKYLLKLGAIDLLDWQENMKLSVHGATLPADVLPGGQLDTTQPTYDASGKQMVLYQLWSAEWIYEYVKGAPEGSGVPDFRVIPNRQHRVPLALCAAKINLSKDHVRRYEPALTSWMRKKPEYDRYIANRGVLAETGAIPRYLLQPKDNALPPLEENGHPIILAEHAMQAYTVPEGYEFVRLGGDGAGSDYVRYGEELRIELQESMPQTGSAEIEASSKPWTVRMMLGQANEFPKMCLDHMVAAYRTMFQNMAEVNGSEDGPGEICFYPKEGGKKDALIVIQPESWKGLRYDAKTNTTSPQEQITKSEHLRELLNDPLVMLPLETYIEEGEGRPNPQEEVAKRLAVVAAKPIIDNLVKMKVTKWAGTKFALTPELRIVDANNRMVSPSEALMSTGQRPTPQPQQPGQAIPPGGGAGPGTPQIRMPSLQGQPAGPGMAPAQGLV